MIGDSPSSAEDREYISKEHRRIYEHMELIEAERVGVRSEYRQERFDEQAHRLQRLTDELARWEWGESSGNAYWDMCRGSFPSPYRLTEDALCDIGKLARRFDENVEFLAVRRLQLAKDDPGMSRYQLSLAYRKLGDCYLSHGLDEKALLAYREGLAMNGNLAVKRIIKTLEAKA